MNHKKIANILTTIAIVGFLNIANTTKANIVSSIQSLNIPCADGKISLDKTTLVCYGSLNNLNKPVTLLDLSNFQTLSSFEHRGTLSYETLIISPDNQNVFLSNSQQSYAWNPSTGANKEIPIKVAAIHPDGRTAYFFDSQAIYSLSVNKLETDSIPNLLFKWEYDFSNRNLIVTPNGKILIGKSGRDVNLWNLQNEKLINKIKADIIDISADSQIIAGAYHTSYVNTRDFGDNIYKTIKLWNLNTGKIIKSISVSLKTRGLWSGQIESLAISPNKKLIAYTFAATYAPSGLAVIDLSNGKLLFKSEAFPDSKYLLGLRLIGFTKDSKRLILANGEEMKILTLK